MELKKLRNDYRIYAGVFVATVWALLAGWNGFNANRESTNNAMIQCDVVDLTAQVSGTLQSVQFKDNQTVTAGELLVEIEPDLYLSTLNRAKAQLRVYESTLQSVIEDAKLSEVNVEGDIEQSEVAIAIAEATYHAIKKQAEQAKASLVSAKARLKLAQIQFNQTNNIYQKDMLSKADFDKAESTYTIQRANVQAAKANIKSLENQIAAQEARLREIKSRASVHKKSKSSRMAKAKANIARQQAQVDVAKAERDLTLLNYSRTQVKALRSGTISNRNVSEGQFVEVGQPLASIVTCSEEVWIEANYKETQVGDMVVGQETEIKIDAYPGITFHGEIESISGGSGAIFSLLPPENATGNFTKVVQRIPVRIKLTDNQGKVMRVGMSAITTVVTSKSVN